MVRRPPRWHIERALRSARLATREAARRGPAWTGDPLAVAGMSKLVELMAEHLGALPSEVQAGFPEIPWREIRGLRGILVHEYHRLDVDRLATTVRQDLPALIAALERMLAELP